MMKPVLLRNRIHQKIKRSGVLDNASLDFGNVRLRNAEAQAEGLLRVTKSAAKGETSCHVAKECISHTECQMHFTY